MATLYARLTTVIEVSSSPDYTPNIAQQLNTTFTASFAQQTASYQVGLPTGSGPGANVNARIPAGAKLVLLLNLGTTQVGLAVGGNTVGTLDPGQQIAFSPADSSTVLLYNVSNPTAAVQLVDVKAWA